MRSVILTITPAFLILAQWTGNALATNGYQLIGVGEGQKSMAGAVTAAKKTLTGKGDIPAGFDAMTPFGTDSGIKISLEETALGLLLSYKF